MAEKKRDYVWLECSSCGQRNYRTEKNLRSNVKLQLRKYCPQERKHTVHNESRKK